VRDRGPTLTLPGALGSSAVLGGEVGDDQHPAVVLVGFARLGMAGKPGASPSR
jgi:hypothetical protein